MHRILEPGVCALGRSMDLGGVQQTEAAPNRLLASIEDNGAGPVGSTYREALRRHGATLAAFVGPEGLAADSDRMVATAPLGKAEERRALLAAAWAGLYGAAP